MSIASTLSAASTIGIHLPFLTNRLIPYLYSEYLKAAEHDDMYFRPLGFDYPDDRRAVEPPVHIPP